VADPDIRLGSQCSKFSFANAAYGGFVDT